MEKSTHFSYSHITQAISRRMVSATLTCASVALDTVELAIVVLTVACKEAALP